VTTRADLRGDNLQTILERARRDPIMRQLATATADDIITYWNGATPAEKDALLLRAVLLTVGLARGVDFG
jgi:hypothetical protein